MYKYTYMKKKKISLFNWPWGRHGYEVLATSFS